MQCSILYVCKLRRRVRMDRGVMVTIAMPPGPCPCPHAPSFCKEILSSSMQIVSALLEGFGDNIQINIFLITSMYVRRYVLEEEEEEEEERRDRQIRALCEIAPTSLSMEMGTGPTYLSHVFNHSSKMPIPSFP